MSEPPTGVNLQCAGAGQQEAREINRRDIMRMTACQTDGIERMGQDGMECIKQEGRKEGG